MLSKIHTADHERKISELRVDRYRFFEWVHSGFSVCLLDLNCVNLILNWQVKEINTVLERRVREEVMKLLDQRENEYLPQVILDTIEVSFRTTSCLQMSENLSAAREVSGKCLRKNIYQSFRGKLFITLMLKTFSYVFHFCHV